MQINFQAVDVNKYRYIQTPIGLLIFEVIGHVYAVQCEVRKKKKKEENAWLTRISEFFYPLVQHSNDQIYLLYLT